jgi:hypothetical protein
MVVPNIIKSYELGVYSLIKYRHFHILIVEGLYKQ